EADLTTKATSISPSSPAEVTIEGRFLYGAPASGLDLEGEVNIAKAEERPGYAGYLFGLNAQDQADQDEDVGTESVPLADLPQTERRPSRPIATRCRLRPSHLRPILSYGWRSLAAERSSASSPSPSRPRPT